ncbi:hypothetical protein K523DRAFT_414217 [Schizophyllum commune Tattone D]|nr:hypothetical protein K523DRAFT_414217 [Schizophyllum commune Tattone D]
MSSSRRSPSLVERFTRPANSLADASAEAAHFLQDIEHEEDAELRKWYREEGIRHQRDPQSLTSGPGGKREVVQNTFKRGQIDQRVKEFDNMKDQYRSLSQEQKEQRERQERHAELLRGSQRRIPSTGTAAAPAQVPKAPRAPTTPSAPFKFEEAPLSPGPKGSTSRFVPAASLPTKYESNFNLRSTDLYVVHSPPPSGTGSTVRQGATAMGHRHTDTVAFGAGHADDAAAPRQSQTHSHRRGHSSDAGSLISKSSSYGSTPSSQSHQARPERTSSGAFGVPATEYTRTSDSSQSDRSKYSSSTHSHPHRHAGGHSSSTFNVADPAFGSTPALPAPADAFVRRSNASTTNLPSAPWHYASAPSFAPGSTFGGQAPRQTLAPPGQTPAGSPYAAPGYPGHPAPAQAPYSAPAQPSRHSSSHKHSSKHGGSRR